MLRGISIAAIAVTVFLCVVVAGCQSSSESGGQAAADLAHGQQIFMTICATCHAPDGTGVKGLGKSFVTSEFVRKASDDQLVDLLTKGRDAKDPLNTTGVLMPPKGGNPSLTEKDLRDVVLYVRTLNRPG
ncbi:MAG TPA: cytochrome c [Candidatus Binatia bacterium]|nr:cytochrome c [Candidatus Binatia bacterium]